MNYIKEMLSDGTGTASSKRLITVLSAILIVIGFMVSLFTSYKIPEYIYTDVMYLVLAGMGVSGAENITNFIQSKMTTPPPPGVEVNVNTNEPADNNNG